MAEFNACTANPECIAILTCFNNCAGDVTCQNACPGMSPAGANDYFAFVGCVICTQCPTTCSAIGTNLCN